MIICFSILIFISSAYAANSEKKVTLEDKRFQNVQIPFVENQGQVADPTVKYTANTMIGNVYVKNNGIDYYLTKGNKRIKISESFQNTKNTQVQGKNPTKTKINYFIGKNSSQWKTNLPTFKQVEYLNLYHGVNLKLKAHGNNIEKIYTIGTLGNPQNILIQINGSAGLKINKSGELEIINNLRSFKLTKPYAYQIINGRKIQVKVAYVVKGTSYGYKTGKYNKKYPLIIDPLLSSTLMGGSSYDHGRDIAVDKFGNIYVTGYTGSENFPATGSAYQGVLNGGEWDAFVAKFDKNLSNLSACSYIGGSDSDQAYGVALDQMGNVLITGITYSPESSLSGFPVTPGAFDTSYNGGGDVFVSKLSTNLNLLLSSTYLGGCELDRANDVLVDASNDVYLTGQTFSPDNVIELFPPGKTPSKYCTIPPHAFPVTQTAYQETYNQKGDAFVSKFNNSLNFLTASTFLGGTESDFGSALVTDQSNYIYVTGGTASTDFPTKNPYSASGATYNGGDYDAFLTKLAKQHLERLEASSFLGGTDSDVGNNIAIDDFGNIYLTGSTYSYNFPKTGSSIGPLGNEDVFVSIFDKYVKKLQVSTTIGGEDNDKGNSIAVDPDGGVYITGTTSSTAFPTSNINGEYRSLNGHDDAFFMFFNRIPSPSDPNRVEPVNNLTGRMFSTYLGSNNADYGQSVALDASENVYITGHTWSDGTYEIPFPTTSGAFDTMPNGVDDVFVTKFSVLQDSPIVKAIDPMDNATYVAVDKNIRIIFYKTIKIGSNWIELKDSTGKSIPISNSTSGNILTINPSVNLSSKTSYVLILHAGSIKNLAGNNNLEFVSHFTTSPYFSISQVKGAATWVKNYIETNYELPGEVSIGSEKINLAQFLHLAVVATYQIDNANFSYIQLKSDNLPSTSYEQMNAGILNPSEYVDFAQRIDDYMNKNQQAPPYGIIVLGQVNYQNQIYLYSRIMDYYNKVGALPVVIAIKPWSVENIPVTDTMPTVEIVDPANNSVKVPTDVRIYLYFKEPITLGNNWIELLSNTGTSVLVKTGVNGNTLTITHPILKKGTKYTLILHTGSIRGLTGNSIFNFATKFTTVPGIPPLAYASPPGGIYKTNQYVTLKMNKSGNIYYTTNGTNPTASSKKYTSPLFLSATTLLKFIAIDLEGTKSIIYTQKYTIDKKSPVVKSTYPYNGLKEFSQTSNLIIEFSENVKIGSQYNKISVTDATTQKKMTISKYLRWNQLIITTTKRTAQTWFNVSIPRGALQDLAGNQLQNQFIFRFKTR